MDLILKKINKGFYQILNKNKNGSTNLLKYELKNAAKYRDEVNDYLKKLKAENLGW